MVEPSATVVIPAHDAAETIAEQLEALATQEDPPEFEVVVVLNRCKDDTATVVEQFSERLAIRAIRADGRASAAYARNSGASVANGDLLLFCDADDRVSPRWVAGMVRALTETDASFVGGSFSVERANLPEWAYEYFYEGLDGAALKSNRDGVVLPISSNLGVTRAAFEAADGFDELFAAAGGEDNDFVTRLLKSGHRVGAAESAVLLYRPRTTARAIAHQRRSYEPGKALLLAKDLRLPEPPTRVSEYRANARWLVSLLRHGTWNPSELYARGMKRIYRQRAERQVWNDATSVVGAPRPDEQIASSDFVVPPATPVIGGLAFRTFASRTHWMSTQGVGRATATILSSVVQPNDVVVDLGADVGVFSVFAGKLVGPRGRVIALEADVVAGRHLQVNIGRHRCDAVVDVLLQEVSDLGGVGGQQTHQVRAVRVGAGVDDLGILDAVVDVLDTRSGCAVLVEGDAIRLVRAAESLKSLGSDRWTWLLADEAEVLAPRGATRVQLHEALPFDTAPGEWSGTLIGISDVSDHQSRGAWWMST
jgi:glycosyltransferase involved in cell wall biosynthesis/precorrin-6B methylase 2